MDIEIVQQIHKTGKKFFAAITGGGQSFLTEFTKIEGASANLIGGIIPYNQKMFDDFVGGRSPAKYVSFEGASKLANASYLQCLKFGVDKKEAIGIGVSSALVQANERVGRQHRSFIVMHTGFGTYSLEAILTKADRTRAEEEEIICEIILNVLAHILDICPLFNFDERYKYINTNFRKETDVNLGYLINDETDLISSQNLAQKQKLVVFSGSFNPLHDGHKTVVNLAKEITGDEVFLELSVKNTDKGLINFIELEDRISGLKDYEFILTNCPTMVKKVEAIKKYAPLAEITLVVGADTWDRIWDEKYGYSLEFLQEFFSNNKIKFIVLPRGGYERKEFVFGNNLEIKHDKINDFKPVAISSSEIRKCLTNQ